MKWRQVQASPASVYVLVLAPGEEALARITAFAREQSLGASQVTAVGAFSRAVVGWFDREAREYRRIGVDEQCEVLSLLGDIVIGEDGPTAHLHAVLGLSDGTTRGGHLLEGQVWPTLEVIVRDSPAALAKIHRPDIGLALIDPEGGPG
ncbi:DNA-binding protein [Streptomyces sp. ISL-22]|uniref:PPC domain-containing DNA-binding protein n=1 Tax=unclassified Streptomyces TaxID=2593676 RepID=UPI001BEB4DDF|nr:MULTISPECIES: PPC domain-containing DNA-binding protein [unclassified Streptomyces]MBT2422548.1 DNA-binding protein [Streptomyces sp. ISL-24]MBT2436599.1 DNA-binding protein [Streptomyces sp. ISL-22]